PDLLADRQHLVGIAFIVIALQPLAGVQAMLMQHLLQCAIFLLHGLTQFGCLGYHTSAAQEKACTNQPRNDDDNQWQGPGAAQADETVHQADCPVEQDSEQYGSENDQQTPARLPHEGCNQQGDQGEQNHDQGAFRKVSQ